MEMIAGWERTQFPVICGHEWAGIVDKAGEGVDESLIGHKCVAENVLTDGGEVGFEHPGGYAEYFITESKNIQLLPDDFSLSTAALIEPLAVSVRGIRRLGNRLTEPILIFGDGPIGLIMIMLLKKEGARQIIVVGGRENRLKLAKELGATQTFNYHDINDDICSATRQKLKHGFGTIIEASGSDRAFHTAVELANVDCGILIVSDYKGGVARFKLNAIIHKELRIIGSNASQGAWTEAVRLAVEGQLPLDKLISHRLPAEQFAEGIMLMRGREQNAIKVVLEWKKC
jgi:(R,R)-butanediol dehydrogenase/meso-butanediol dehydrogenase/diacetyl reductase